MTMLRRHIDCLDRGYVRLVSWMPWSMAELYATLKSEYGHLASGLLDQDDLISVNAARASFAKTSYELAERDRRLIRFLAEHHEDSPFRHAILHLEIKAPLVVARQWHKYRIGAVHSGDQEQFIGVEFGEGDDAGFDDLLYARNESSRRYVTSEPEFYTPKAWRQAPHGRNKQGSAGPMSAIMQDKWNAIWKLHVDMSHRKYAEALEDGMAPEMARMFLPAYALYLHWRLTASLVSICHFLNERLADNAQREIQEYAQAIWALVSQPGVYPLSAVALVPQATQETQKGGVHS